MQKNNIYRANLKSLILGLTIISALLSFSNTFFASYQTQSEHLVATTLELNRAYSKKLASSLDNFFASTQQQLAYSTQVMQNDLGNTAILKIEAERLLNQTTTFNSVVIADKNGIVLEVAPNSLEIKGKKLTSIGAREAYSKKAPTISDVYTSITGKLIVFVTHPIFDKSNEYFGFIGGTIYLETENILNKLIGQHFYEDGSHVLIIDKNSIIISYKDQHQIGKTFPKDSIHADIISELDGSNKTTDLDGKELLSGYAFSHKTGWAIITQKRTDDTKTVASQLLHQALLHSLPVALISIVAIWWCSLNIARPLRQLADGARDLEKANSKGVIEKISAWYYETKELKSALLSSAAKIQKNISILIDEAITDSLTGLYNRRGLEKSLAPLMSAEIKFSIALIDIDHFKKINDTYGHDKGDIALKFLSQKIKQAIREEDLAFRVGGEEFMIVLPKAEKSDAYTIAERLRISIMQTEIPEIGNITVSLGISSWPEDGREIADVIKSADKRLYLAKQNGRNQSMR